MLFVLSLTCQDFVFKEYADPILGRPDCIYLAWRNITLWELAKKD